MPVMPYAAASLKNEAHQGELPGMSVDDILTFEFSDKFLDIVYHRDDFDTSDLQGAIEAQVRMLIRAVRKNI